MAKLMSLITILSLLELIKPQIQSNQLQVTSASLIYVNCSSVYCVTCLNQYLCANCRYNEQPVCCPNFCLKCLDMNHCIQCQVQFMLVEYQNSIICSRITNNTDVNVNSSSSVVGNCNDGYYYQNITNTCFSCNYANCQNCSSYQNCILCNSGYFFFTNISYNVSDGSQNVTVNCAPCLPNCANCSNINTCINCQLGYFLAPDDTCSLCQIKDCFECSNKTTCTKCLNTHYMLPNSTTCILCSTQIPNCDTCQYNTTQKKVLCTNCANQFYSKTQVSCLACPQNCSSCSNSASSAIIICDSDGCFNGYTFNNNTNSCIVCDSNCNECDYINSTAFNCTQCASGFMNQSQNNLSYCVQCPFPCVYCYTDQLGQYHCGVCYAGFYVNYVGSSIANLGQCYFCSLDNCLQCQQKQFCTLCQDGYYLVLSPVQNIQYCTSCPSNCLKCQLKPISSNSTALQVRCSLCQTGYIPKNGICIKCNTTTKYCLICNLTDITNCIQCLPGYYLDVINDCNPCSTVNCFNCNYDDVTQNNTCITCNISYYLTTVNNVQECLLCANNCLNCLNSSFCTECNQNYYIVTQNKTQNCQICPSLCLNCDQNGCIFCQDGFYSSPIATSTVNVLCLSCTVIPGCVLCFNNQYCKQCSVIGYASTPTVQGNCTPCLAGCLTCDYQLVCSQCYDGYLLLQQINQCIQEGGIPIWGIFVCATFGFALIFVLLQKLRRMIKKRKQRQLQQLQQNLQSSLRQNTIIQISQLSQSNGR